MKLDIQYIFKCAFLLGLWGACTYGVDAGVPCASFSSQYFSSELDFRKFFFQHAKTEEKTWPGIMPASYVFALDFTVSQAHGVRVLELNGPNYSVGYLNIPGSGELTPWLRRPFLRAMGSLSETGTVGHDELFKGCKLSVNDQIEASSRDFCHEFGWNLKLVQNVKRVNAFWEEPDPEIDRAAYLPLGNDAEFFNWRRSLPKSLLLNQPTINFVTHTKSTLKLLPTVEGVSIDSLLLPGRVDSDVLAQIEKLASQTRASHFILKPTHAHQSIGVKLVTRDELLSIYNSKRTEFLKAFQGWILQPYYPSDPLRLDDGKFTSPVGRVFYHVIYDGVRIRAIPLTAYQKINQYRYTSAQDIFEPSKVGFSTLDTAAEFDRESLTKILHSTSRYVTAISGALFELAQRGFSGESIESNGVLQRFESLHPFEKRVLISSVPRGLFTVAYAMERVWDWEGRLMLESRPQQVLFMPSPLYLDLTGRSPWGPLQTCALEMLSAGKRLLSK